MRNSGRMDFDFFSSPSLFVKEVEMTGFFIGTKATPYNGFKFSRRLVDGCRKICVKYEVNREMSN